MLGLDEPRRDHYVSTLRSNPEKGTTVSGASPRFSSSRRASASRPSPTWTRSRRSLPPRWQRRPASRRQQTLAGELARKPCVVRSPVSAVAPRQPRRRSALVVLVVAAPPDARLVAPLGGALQPLVHGPEAVQSARIGGIGGQDDAAPVREWPHGRALQLA